ncbi:MAG: RHS repeat-associated core domain-containing protein, partial [Candidatus Omnitrophica bacterium]|nr:RHS repeat-associated core domain-containing protein [Candidatus Omnitrophota bacterium]
IYEYDALGNRISKTVNGVRTQYLVNIAQGIPQVLAEMDSAGNVTKSYAYGMDRIAQTSASGDAGYFLSDGLGSHVGLLNASGNVEQSYQYDAFGSSLMTDDRRLTTFLYTGEQRDPETGLIYLRARYYDPALGRFTSRDPQYVGTNSETQSYNPFIYVQNDPVNWIDPFGLERYRKQRELDEKPFDGFYDSNPGTQNPFRHDQFWWDKKGPDGEITNLGYGPRGIFSESTTRNSEYVTRTIYYDDTIFDKAIGIVKQRNEWKTPGSFPSGPYMPSCHDCQDFADAVEELYVSMRGKLEHVQGKQDETRKNSNIPPGGGGGGSSGSGPGFSLGDFIDGIFLGRLEDFVGGIFDGIASLFRGGVYMDKALNVIGENIKDIEGVSYDPVTGQIIMLSKNDASVPEVPVDYFLAALRAVFGEAQTAPGVSIDPVYDGNNQMLPNQNVRFLGGIENTALGKAVYGADLLMKLIGLGVDNTTDDNIPENGQDISESYISSRIPGFKDIFTLSSEVSDPNILTQNLRLRFWFTPKEMKLVRSSAGDAFVFDENSVELKTETSFLGGDVTSADPRAIAFAQFFNDHFSELAALYPEFAELEKGMRAVGLAKFIKDNNIPVDLNWLSQSTFPVVTTPATTPTATAARTIVHQGTSQTIPLTFAGGVTYNLFEGQNFQYLLDSQNQAAGLRDAAQGARSSDLDKEWLVELGGQAYQAKALSLSPTKKDGSFSWQNSDLGYSTQGSNGLVFQRYYDSFLARENTPLGYGWQNIPYQLDFPVADSEELVLSGTDQVQITVPPKILFMNWPGHQLLEFEPYALLTEGRVIYAPKDGKVKREFFIRNADGTYTCTTGGNQIYFNAEGILEKIEDPNGNQISYNYDAQKKLSSIKDETSGRQISLSYDGQGRVAQASGPDGRSVSYGYDASGNLGSVTQSWTSRTITFTYNADHQLTSAVDYSGRQLFENSFDEIGRLRSQTNFLGIQSQFAPNLLEQETVYTNMVTGSQNTQTYNENFQVTSQTNTLGDTVSYTYGSNNLFGPLSATDANGNTSYFAYDAFGNISEITDALGNKTKYYYNRVNGNNKPVFIENPDGHGTGYVYDLEGNLTDVYEATRILNVQANGDLDLELTNLHTHLEYNASGQLIRAVNPVGDEIHYEYDDAGHIIKVTDGLGNEMNTSYLQRNGIATGQASQVTDAMGRSMQYIYDPNTDLLTRTIDPFALTLYSYDSRDRLTQVEDGLGRQMGWAYNNLDQLITAVNRGWVSANDIAVNYGYDTLGRLATIAGPTGAVTAFGYDVLNRTRRMGISENTPSYGMLNSLNIENIEEEKAGVVFNINAGINQVKVKYRGEGTADFTELLLNNPSSGEHHVDLENLDENTQYEVELELTDNQGKVSYSRQYDFKTRQTAPPEIQSIFAENVTENAATIRFGVSKEVTVVNIKYHVIGEARDQVIRMEGAQEGFIDVALESLRSGRDYSVEVTVTDRGGRTDVKTRQFKTLGEISDELPSAYIQSEAIYGHVMLAYPTQAFFSLENPNVSDPFAEAYELRIWDGEGNLVTGWSFLQVTSAQLGGKLGRIVGLTANKDYVYTLTMQSRSDIPVIAGGFHTPDGTDTQLPDFTSGQHHAPDSENILFVVKFTENLRMLQLTLTDNETGEVKKYYFFNLSGEEFHELLLDHLTAGHTYGAKLAALDLSGNYFAPLDLTLTTSTQMAEDETPPQVTERTILERTSTTATVKLISSELLRKLKLQYRVAGTEEWWEEAVLETASTFQIPLTTLGAGTSYEYRYILEDLSGNQLVTAWEGL